MILSLDELLQRPAWQADALCLEHPELNWFPSRGQDVSKPIAVCKRCAVRDECLDLALQHAESGIWGATTERHRKRMRRAARTTTPEQETA